MKVIDNEFPPNIDAIRAVFPLRGAEIFAYGDKIYNPSGKPIPPWLLMHEAMHEIQQGEVGVTEWWDRYLVDPKFRYEQELEAHQVEFKAYCSPELGHDRNQRRAYLKMIARRLSSPMYGNVASFEKARRAIRKP